MPIYLSPNFNLLSKLFTKENLDRVDSFFQFIKRKEFEGEKALLENFQDAVGGPMFQSQKELWNHYQLEPTRRFYSHDLYFVAEAWTGTYALQDIFTWTALNKPAEFSANFPLALANKDILKRVKDNWPMYEAKAAKFLSKHPDAAEFVYDLSDPTAWVAGSVLKSGFGFVGRRAQMAPLFKYADAVKRSNPKDKYDLLSSLEGTTMGHLSDANLEAIFNNRKTSNENLTRLLYDMGIRDSEWSSLVDLGRASTRRASHEVSARGFENLVSDSQKSAFSKVQLEILTDLAQGKAYNISSKQKVTFEEMAKGFSNKEIADQFIETAKDIRREPFANLMKLIPEPTAAEKKALDSLSAQEWESVFSNLSLGHEFDSVAIHHNQRIFNQDIEAVSNFYKRVGYRDIAAQKISIGGEEIHGFRSAYVTRVLNLPTPRTVGGIRDQNKALDVILKNYQKQQITDVPLSAQEMQRSLASLSMRSAPLEQQVKGRTEKFLSHLSDAENKRGIFAEVSDRERELFIAGAKDFLKEYSHIYKMSESSPKFRSLLVGINTAMDNLFHGTRMLALGDIESIFKEGTAAKAAAAPVSAVTSFGWKSFNVIEDLVKSFATVDESILSSLKSNRIVEKPIDILGNTIKAPEVSFRKINYEGIADTPDWSGQIANQLRTKVYRQQYWDKANDLMELRSKGLNISDDAIHSASKLKAEESIARIYFNPDAAGPILHGIAKIGFMFPKWTVANFDFWAKAPLNHPGFSLKIAESVASAASTGTLDADGKINFKVDGREIRIPAGGFINGQRVVQTLDNSMQLDKEFIPSNNFEAFAKNFYTAMAAAAPVVSGNAPIKMVFTMIQNQGESPSVAIENTTKAFIPAVRSIEKVAQGLILKDIGIEYTPDNLVQRIYGDDVLYEHEVSRRVRDQVRIDPSLGSNIGQLKENVGNALITEGLLGHLWLNGKVGPKEPGYYEKMEMRSAPTESRFEMIKKNPEFKGIVNAIPDKDTNDFLDLINIGIKTGVEKTKGAIEAIRATGDWSLEKWRNWQRRVIEGDDRLSSSILSFGAGEASAEEITFSNQYDSKYVLKKHNLSDVERNIFNGNSFSKYLDEINKSSTQAKNAKAEIKFLESPNIPIIKTHFGPSADSPIFVDEKNSNFGDLTGLAKQRVVNDLNRNISFLADAGYGIMHNSSSNTAQVETTRKILKDFPVSNLGTTYEKAIESLTEKGVQNIPSDLQIKVNNYRQLNEYVNKIPTPSEVYAKRNYDKLIESVDNSLLYSKPNNINATLQTVRKELPGYESYLSRLPSDKPLAYQNTFLNLSASIDQGYASQLGDGSLDSIQRMVNEVRTPDEGIGLIYSLSRIAYSKPDFVRDKIASNMNSAGIRLADPIESFSPVARLMEKENNLPSNSLPLPAFQDISKVYSTYESKPMKILRGPVRSFTDAVYNVVNAKASMEDEYKKYPFKTSLLADGTPIQKPTEKPTMWNVWKRAILEDPTIPVRFGTELIETYDFLSGGRLSPEMKENIDRAKSTLGVADTASMLFTAAGGTPFLSAGPAGIAAWGVFAAVGFATSRSRQRKARKEYEAKQAEYEVKQRQIEEENRRLQAERRDRESWEQSLRTRRTFFDAVSKSPQMLQRFAELRSEEVADFIRRPTFSSSVGLARSLENQLGRLLRPRF